MRILLENQDGVVRVHKFFPMGGLVPTGIEVEPGELVLLSVQAGEVSELQREAAE